VFPSKKRRVANRYVANPNRETSEFGGIDHLATGEDIPRYTQALLVDIDWNDRLFERRRLLSRQVDWPAKAHRIGIAPLDDEFREICGGLGLRRTADSFDGDVIRDIVSNGTTASEPPEELVPTAFEDDIPGFAFDRGSAEVAHDEVLQLVKADACMRSFVGARGLQSHAAKVFEQPKVGPPLESKQVVEVQNCFEQEMTAVDLEVNFEPTGGESVLAEQTDPVGRDAVVL
jgi:hypothetical protein